MSASEYRTNFECRLCQTSGAYPLFTVREMMYGSRRAFDYIHCLACGCLQILKIPSQLGQHYPSDYYSQAVRDEPAPATGLKGALIRWYCRSATLRPKSVMEGMLRACLPVPADFAALGNYLVEAHLKSSKERILDVGCGSSPHRLAAFRRCGFTAVEGIDPFIAEDTFYHGVPVYRRTLEEMEGQFGMIMFHHSLEHVPDPLNTLRSAVRLLRSGGLCLVRIPVMSTYFWRTFGVDWVEIDAPRHLHMMAAQTIEMLAKKTGFQLRKTTFDSQGWEIAASHQFRANIPLRDARSFVHTGVNGMFSADRWAKFEDQSRELNRVSDAGRACFYLEKI